MPAERVVTVAGSTIFPEMSNTVNNTFYCHSQLCATAGIADASKNWWQWGRSLKSEKKLNAVQSVKPNACLSVIEGDPALLYFQGLVLGERVNVLLDMGASHLFAPKRLVQALQLPVQEYAQ